MKKHFLSWTAAVLFTIPAPLSAALFSEQPFGDKIGASKFDLFAQREFMERTWIKPTNQPGEPQQKFTVKWLGPGDILVAHRYGENARSSLYEVKIRRIETRSGGQHYIVFWRQETPERNELGWDKAWRVAWVGFSVEPAGLIFFEADEHAFNQVGLKKSTRSLSLLNSHTLLTDDPEKITTILKSKDSRLFMNPGFFAVAMAELTADEVRKTKEKTPTSPKK